MGARGRGAISAKAKAVHKFKRQPWQKKGLSRSDAVIEFCHSMRVTSGKRAGEFFRLEPFQIEFIEAIYRTGEHGKRPCRTAVLSLGRKNGKTGLAALLTGAHTFGPESEPRGQTFAAANDRAQASVLFNEVTAMIAADPDLRMRTNVKEYQKQIEVETGPGAGTIFQALTAEASTKFGLNCNFFTQDEFGFAPDPRLYDALATSQGARDEPLALIISTQAAADHHPMSRLIDYGEQINRGEVDDPTFVSRLYAASPECALDDPVAWEAANPALNSFRSKSDIERQAVQAIRMPSNENSFRNLILNQRVDSVSRFIRQSEWEACNDTVEIQRGAKCWGGLDLSWSRDLTAFVLAFPQPDGTIAIKTHCWLPSEGLAHKSREDRVPWDEWARAGHLHTSPGATINPADVAQEILTAERMFDLQAVAFDRWGISHLKRELEKVGSTVALHPHGQGFKDMHPAVTRVERELAHANLRHGGHPILRMAATNAICETDPAGNKKLSKSASNQTGRIDPIVAMAMALNAIESFEVEPVAQMPASIAQFL